ncbi:hypothetical protein KKC94_00200 [Patescibacteria group bacterium]|nr:hypothetical protein [Patescibacteria group bacterium]
MESTKYIESRDFKTAVREPETFTPANDIEITAEQVKNLERFERVLGKEARVAVDEENNVAAKVETNSKQVYVSLETLKRGTDDTFVAYAAKHEKTHIDNGVKGLDLKGQLSPDKIQVIERNLISNTFDATNVLEGFTDWQAGEHEKSGYKDLVQDAKTLDQLSKENGNGSLIDVFKEPTIQEFYDRLRLTAENLLK